MSDKVQKVKDYNLGKRKDLPKDAEVCAFKTQRDKVSLHLR